MRRRGSRPSEIGLYFTRASRRGEVRPYIEGRRMMMRRGEDEVEEGRGGDGGG